MFITNSIYNFVYETTFKHYISAFKYKADGIPAIYCGFGIAIFIFLIAMPIIEYYKRKNNKKVIVKNGRSERIARLFYCLVYLLVSLFIGIFYIYIIFILIVVHIILLIFYFFSWLIFYEIFKGKFYRDSILIFTFLFKKEESKLIKKINYLDKYNFEKIDEIKKILKAGFGMDYYNDLDYYLNAYSKLFEMKEKNKDIEINERIENSIDMAIERINIIFDKIKNCYETNNSEITVVGEDREKMNEIKNNLDILESMLEV